MSGFGLSRIDSARMARGTTTMLPNVPAQRNKARQAGFMFGFLGVNGSLPSRKASLSTNQQAGWRLFGAEPVVLRVFLQITFRYKSPQTVTPECDRIFSVRSGADYTVGTNFI